MYQQQMYTPSPMPMQQYDPQQIILANCQEANNQVVQILNDLVMQGYIDQQTRSNVMAYVNTPNPGSRNSKLVDAVASQLGASPCNPNIINGFVRRYIENILMQMRQQMAPSYNQYNQYGYPYTGQQSIQPQNYGQYNQYSGMYNKFADVNPGYGRYNVQREQSSPLLSGTPTPNNGTNRPVQTTTSPTTVVCQATGPTREDTNITMDDTTTVSLCQVHNLVDEQSIDLAEKRTPFYDITRMLRYEVESHKVLSNVYLLKYPYNSLQDAYIAFTKNNHELLSSSEPYAHIVEWDELHIIPGSYKIYVDRWKDITQKFFGQKVSGKIIRGELNNLGTLGDSNYMIKDILVDLVAQASYVLAVSQTYTGNNRSIATFYPDTFEEAVDMLTGNMDASWTNLPTFSNLQKYLLNSSVGKIFSNKRTPYLEPAFDSSNKPNQDACVLVAHPAMSVQRNGYIGAHILVNMDGESSTSLTSYFDTVFPLKVRHKLILHNLDLPKTAIADDKYELELTPNYRVLEEIFKTYESVLDLVGKSGEVYTFGKTCYSKLLVHRVGKV